MKDVTYWLNHDFRQPVCTARGLVELLKDDQDLPSHLLELVRLLDEKLQEVDHNTRQAVNEWALCQSRLQQNHTCGCSS